MSFTGIYPCMNPPVYMNDSYGKQTILIKFMQQRSETFVVGHAHSNAGISVVPLEGTKDSKQY